MPVALLRTDAPHAFAPLAGREVILGADRSCDVVELAPGVEARHASLRYVHGEWLLAAEGPARLEVNGRAQPVMALREGDVIRLAPAARTWRFRNRLADAFVPPDASFAAAWTGHPGFGDPRHGPAGLGPAEAIDGRDAARCGVVAAGGGRWVVKRLPVGRGPQAPERHLRLLARLGGAPHRALARLVEGGLCPAPEGVGRWMATAWIEGRSARSLVEEGGVPPHEALHILRRLAAGLVHLHARGVIHRDVSPGNVIVRGREAVLIDFGQAVLADAPLPASAGVVGTPGYVAPEEVLEGPAAVTTAVDVYGLAAVGYALLTGAPSAFGEDVLATLSRAARPAIPLEAMGAEVPPALEAALLHALDPDPSARPDAAGLRSALELAEAQLGLGGRT